MGRKLAEKWKGVFVEASAKENEVSWGGLSEDPLERYLTTEEFQVDSQFFSIVDIEVLNYDSESHCFASYRR